MRRQMMTMRRVVVWGTGPMGRDGLRMVIDHPDLELVGVHAWSKEKVGMDAGDIAGVGPTGVQLTDDIDELLSLEADCLAYFANAANRHAEATADVVPFLERGTNVATISHFDVGYPAHGRPEYVDPIREACERGKSSIFLTGDEPGFGFGAHLYSMLNVAGHVDQIDLADISDVRKYPAVDSLDNYGFNKPLDYLPPMFTSDVGASWHFNTLRGIADFIGVKVDEIRQTWDTAAVDDDYETAAYGLAKAGATAAIWWKVEAMVGGSPLLVYNKILRLHEDAAPDWPDSALAEGRPGVTLRINIAGNPNIENQWFRVGADLRTTPLSAIAAIPFVCDAPPGIRVQHEVPFFPPRNVRNS
jgi:2,4-diaminopentanoate dehydrogenase